MGAAFALPLGMVIGTDRAAAPVDTADIGLGLPSGERVRQVYSPRFRGDPYVLAEQRRIADALELSCRQSKIYCEEAKQARMRIDEAEGRR